MPSTGVLRGGLQLSPISVPVPATGDVTLTGDQARAAKITFTGAPSGPFSAVLPVTAEDFGETWTFVNSTSQTITVKGAVGAGYALSANQTAALAWTGADFVPGPGPTQVGTTGERLSFTGTPGIVDAQFQITSDPGGSIRAMSAWIEPGPGAPLNRNMRALDAQAVIRNADTGVYTGQLNGAQFTAIYGGATPGSSAEARGVNVTAGIQKLTGFADGTGTLAQATGIQVNIVAVGSPTGVITQGTGIILVPPTVPGGGIGTMMGLRIQNQGGAGITTSYGLRVNAQSGSGTTLSIVSEGGECRIQTGADATIGLGIRQNSGSQSGDLLRLATSAGAALVSFAGAGHLTFTDAINIVFGTTTGTKIGTLGGAAGQKMAFWNATPIVQPLLATGAAHTVDDVITVLQNLGLCRQS